MQNTADMYQAVRDFHRKMHLPLDVPYSKDLLAVKRLRLMYEEFGELVVALDTNNIIEAADAICDLLYVVAGTAASFGLRFYSEDFSSWPKVKEVPKTLGADSKVFFITSIGWDLGQISSAMGVPDVMFLRVKLHALVNTCLSLASAMNLPIAALYAEVHRSNMSKTPLDEHMKGGKGGSYTPPNLEAILYPTEEV